ncbi:MAG: hypothetical protein ABS876_01105 [Ruminococcus sp.]
MSFQSKQYGKYLLRLARPDDNDGIRAIFESGSFAGGLNVQFLRGERPLPSFEADGGRAYILVAEDTEAQRLIAVGGAVVRTEYLSGAPSECAYLTGLKIHRDYRGRLSFISRAYGFMGEMVSDCAATYTTILDGNTGVRKMLEKRRKNMPEYHYLGHYTTFCLGRGKKLMEVEKNVTDGFDTLLKTHFSKKDLTPCRPDYRGFGRKDFYSVRGSDGEIAACCFIGDQSATKYYKMCSYGGVYRLASHLPTALFGYPAFPKEGERIISGVISYLYVRGNDASLCKSFLLSAARASGFPLLLWGGFDGDPLCEAVGRLKTVKYGSRLYEVLWNGSAAGRISGKIGMEAALL